MISSNQSPNSLPEDYLQFLRDRLPELKKHSLSFWRRSRKTKHDTLRYIINNQPFDQNGLIAEFGVFKGVTINMMAKKLPNCRLYGFDSFTGFPEDGRSDWQHDFSRNGELPEAPDNVQFIKGYFEDSLPQFVRQHEGQQFSLLHIDCDIYSSTKTIFKHCTPMIKPGCVIVFDELLHYNGFEHNEMLAFYEFLNEQNLDFEWLAIRKNVMLIEEYLNQQAPFHQGKMQDWRNAGFEQEVAVRIKSK